MKLALDPARLTGGLREAGPVRDRLIRGLRLTDGGVYDNMGLEPVWKSHQVLLVSDGGSAFQPVADSGPYGRLGRYIDLIGRQNAATRKRWLISNFVAGELQGTYWGISSAPERYGDKRVIYDDVVELTGIFLAANQWIPEPEETAGELARILDAKA